MFSSWHSNQRMPRIVILDEMKKITILGITVLLTACFSLGGHAQNLIPKPQSIVKTEGTLAISQLKGVMSNLNEKEFAQLKAFIPQTKNLKLNSKKLHSAHKDTGGYLQLICTGNAQQARLASDNVRLQGYTLKFSRHGVTIKAPTSMGLFYGLQTLRQLEDHGKLPYVDITDQPK